MNLKSWEEVVRDFPEHTTRERLSAFLKCNFQHGARPASFVVFAKDAHQRSSLTVLFESQVSDAFLGTEAKCMGYRQNMDVLKLDDTIITENNFFYFI